MRSKFLLRPLFILVAAATTLLGPPTPEASAADTEVSLADAAKIASVTLKLSGLHCASCSIKIRSALKKLKGIDSLSEGSSKKHLIVKYQSSRVSPKKIIKTIEEAGYQASIVQ